MKGLFAIVCSALLLPLSVSAQHYVGLKGGWGFSDARFYPKYETKMIGGMLNGGVSWTYYDTKPRSIVDRYAGGVSVELEFLQRGYRYASLTTFGKDYKRVVDAVVLPFLWQPHFFIAQGRLLAFFNAGVTLNCNISSTEYEIDLDTGESVSTPYDIRIARDNRWGYGLCGGFGVGASLTDRITLRAEGRYYFGYSDILKRKNINSDNLFMRSPLDNIIISVGAVWRLGGDPSDRAVPSRSEWRAMRNAVGEPMAE